MRTNVEEDIKARRFNETKDGGTYTSNWIIKGTSNPLEAQALIGADKQFGSQLILEGIQYPLFISARNFEEVEGLDQKQKPFRFVKATLTYTRPLQEDPPDAEPNKATWRITTTGVVAHIETPIEGTTQQFFPNLPTTYAGQAIGLAADGGVNGVDVLRPRVGLVIQHWLPVQAVTQRFMDDIQKLAGHINKSSFRGPWGRWRKSEALYEGAEVGAINDDLIEITHSFTRSFNARNLEIKTQAVKGGKISIPFKGGHQYFWSRIRDGVETGDPTKPLKSEIISAHIADVYPSLDFDVLQLPSDFVGGQL